MVGSRRVAARLVPGNVLAACAAVVAGGLWGRRPDDELLGGCDPLLRWELWFLLSDVSIVCVARARTKGYTESS